MKMYADLYRLKLLEVSDSNNSNFRNDIFIRRLEIELLVLKIDHGVWTWYTEYLQRTQKRTSNMSPW